MRKRTSLHDRKYVNLNSGVHIDPHIERYVGSSLPRTGRRVDYDYYAVKRIPSCATFRKKNRRLNIILAENRLMEFSSGED